MNTTNIAVEWSRINKPKEKNIRGVDTITMLSPFNLPENVSVAFDENTRIAHFKFEYLTNEKTHTEKVCVRGEYELRLALGKVSNRVYEIEIDLAQSSLHQKNNILEDILNGLKEYLILHPDRKLGSFEAVENVLNVYENTLIPDDLYSNAYIG